MLTIYLIVCARVCFSYKLHLSVKCSASSNNTHTVRSFIRLVIFFSICAVKNCFIFLTHKMIQTVPFQRLLLFHTLIDSLP